MLINLTLEQVESVLDWTDLCCCELINSVPSGSLPWCLKSVCGVRVCHLLPFWRVYKVFGVESSTLSRVSEAGVTARLWLLYVIFMGVASSRCWGPECVQLGEDRLPPPLVFSGVVCETFSNKLPISGKVGDCARFCTGPVFRMTSSRLRLETSLPIFCKWA